MVDALLSAAAESDSALADIIAGRNEDTFIIRHDERHSQTPQRFCEFCHSSNTPTWRRGPAGKGSLCNACGIKWRLRNRLKKNEKGSPSSPPTTPDKRASPSITKPHKKRKERDSSPKAPRQLVKDKDPMVEYTVKENKRKKYYCKYCDQTFSLSQFRNSQQFGAHCSNCSRRPGRFGEDGVSLYDMDAHRDYGYGRYSPYDSPSSVETERSSPESPSLAPLPQTNNRNGLLMRLLYVVEHQLVDVHELADIKDELSTLKDELISREEARKEELTTMHARVKEDLADIKTNFQNSVAAHEQLAATRLMEMEQTIKMRGPGGMP